MATIKYAGLEHRYFGFSGTEAFHFLLHNNPNLRVVTVSHDENGKEIFTDFATPRYRAFEENVGIIDTDNNDQFMWIFYDGLTSVESPSAALTSLLVDMDNFVRVVQEARLFTSDAEDYSPADMRLLDAAFDFTTGNYDFTREWYEYITEYEDI